MHVTFDSAFDTYHEAAMMYMTTVKWTKDGSCAPVARRAAYKTMGSKWLTRMPALVAVLLVEEHVGFLKAM